MLPTQSLYNHYLSDDTYRRDAAIISEAELAEEIGRVRLQWDIHETLQLLYKELCRDELARKHEVIAQGIVQQIRENLQQSEMRAGLPV